jgi:cell cycle checkpoint protein
MNSKFVGFLSRNAYNPLALANTAPTPSTSQHSNIPAVSQPRILLLTSLPNLSHLPTRQTFHQALMDYTKSFTSTSCPLVIVVPDAGNSGAAEESWIGADSSGDGAWDLRSVIGKDLVENPAVRIIEWVVVQYLQLSLCSSLSIELLLVSQIPSDGPNVFSQSS